MPSYGGGKRECSLLQGGGDRGYKKGGGDCWGGSVICMCESEASFLCVRNSPTLSRQPTKDDLSFILLSLLEEKGWSGGSGITRYGHPIPSADFFS